MRLGDAWKWKVLLFPILIYCILFLYYYYYYGCKQKEPSRSPMYQRILWNLREKKNKYLFRLFSFSAFEISVSKSKKFAFTSQASTSLFVCLIISISAESGHKMYFVQIQTPNWSKLDWTKRKHLKVQSVISQHKQTYDCLFVCLIYKFSHIIFIPSQKAIIVKNGHFRFVFIQSRWWAPF